MVQYKKFTSMMAAATTAMVMTVGFQSQASDGAADAAYLPCPVPVLSFADWFLNVPEGAAKQAVDAAGHAQIQYERKKETERKAAEAARRAKAEEEPAEAVQLAAGQDAVRQAASAAVKQAAETAASVQLAAGRQPAETAAFVQLGAEQQAVETAASVETGEADHAAGQPVSAELAAEPQPVEIVAAEQQIAEQLDAEAAVSGQTGEMTASVQPAAEQRTEEASEPGQQPLSDEMSAEAAQPGQQPEEGMAAGQQPVEAAAEMAPAEPSAEPAYATENAVQAASGEQTLLAALIFCEAGNQSYEGQVAVGAVVMNRVRSSQFPDSIPEVIYQSGQFSPAMSGWLDSVLASGGYTDSAFQAAADALAGSSPIGEYLYFDCGGYGYQLGDHFFH